MSPHFMGGNIIIMSTKFNANCTRTEHIRRATYPRHHGVRGVQEVADVAFGGWLEAQLAVTRDRVVHEHDQRRQLPVIQQLEQTSRSTLGYTLASCGPNVMMHVWWEKRSNSLTNVCTVTYCYKIFKEEFNPAWFFLTLQNDLLFSSHLVK